MVVAEKTPVVVHLPLSGMHKTREWWDIYFRLFRRFVRLVRPASTEITSMPTMPRLHANAAVHVRTLAACRTPATMRETAARNNPDIQCPATGSE